ncbi:MAG: hypothetical protein ACP5OE_09355 [Thermodesulfobium sp.]
MVIIMIIKEFNNKTFGFLSAIKLVIRGFTNTVSLIRNQDTNRAYAEVSNNNNILLKGMSKSTFFQSVNYLQNLGLITLIKKKIGRYYTMESQILLLDECIIQGELKKKELLGLYWSGVF